MEKLNVEERKERGKKSRNGGEKIIAKDAIELIKTENKSK